MAVKLERRHMTSSEDEPGTSYVQLDFDTQDEASTSTQGNPTSSGNQKRRRR